MPHSFSISRRGMLRMASLGVAAGAVPSWMQAFAADAVDHPERKKSVIMLWLNGGPATIDMWDLKPGHANGGSFKPIDTTAPGLQISENFPKLATHGKEMVVVRSMSSKEGDHGRATLFFKTGYLPVGAIQFPAVGSVVAHELAEETSDLPGFVSIGSGRNGSSLGGGFLGPRFSPLVIAEGGTDGNGQNAAGVEGLRVPDLERIQGVSDAAQRERLSLLYDLEKRFGAQRTSSVVAALQSANTRAARLMEPQAAGTFQLDGEDEKLRDSYGRNLFGQGCLLARRLVEKGVPFVEVNLGGWDTHQNNFERVKGLSTTLDNGFAALLKDLSDRGLLASTLVVCAGEFGRTPKINGNNGRDHFPAAFSTVMAGGGIKGGQVIGKSSPDGMTVVENPVTVPDLISTVCKAIGIDPKKQNMSNVSRPIRVADPDAKPIVEVL